PAREERCRPASNTNDDMTAGPQHAIHLAHRAQWIGEVKEGIEREDEIKGLIRKLELLRVHSPKGHHLAQAQLTRFGTGLLYHSWRVIDADDAAPGQQRRHPKRQQAGSRADIENAVRRLQLRQFYHPNRDRRTEPLREAVELRCDLVIARRIDLLVIHKQCLQY